MNLSQREESMGMSAMEGEIITRWGGSQRGCKPERPKLYCKHSLGDHYRGNGVLG